MSANSWTSRYNSFSDFATNLDMFGERFSFKLPGNKTHHGTPLGCCFTALLVMTFVLQTVLKSGSLVNLDDTTIHWQVEEGFFNSSHVFSSSDGFKIAFAITAYDSNHTITEDPTYGRLVARYRSWDGEMISRE